MGASGAAPALSAPATMAPPVVTGGDPFSGVWERGANQALMDKIGGSPFGAGGIPTAGSGGSGAKSMFERLASGVQSGGQQEQQNRLPPPAIYQGQLTPFRPFAFNRFAYGRGLMGG